MEALNRTHIEEEAFGFGRVTVWDQGKAEINEASHKRLVLTLTGRKITGKYEFRRMFWYPGNRWLMTKLAESAKTA